MRAQFCQRLRTVADAIFHVGSQLGEALGEAIRHEQRIVTETASPAGQARDSSFAGTVEQIGFSAAIHRGIDSGERDHATKAGGALPFRDMLHEVQQLSIVLGVSGVAFGSGIESREARGVHSGRTIQSVHFQAGVIGNDKP